MANSEIEALFEERAGYVLRGLKGRVAQVDAAIKAAGGVVVDDTPEAAVAPPEVETAAPKKAAPARKAAKRG